MLSYIWAALVLLSIGVGIVTGQGEILSESMFLGASSAIELVITIIGISAFWGGIMEIAKASGAIDVFARAIRPFVRLLFKNIKSGSEIERAISANVAANIIGVANAATPLGLLAMQEMKKESGGKFTDNMAMLVLINTASVQILPSSVIALRILEGSAEPYAIMPYVWVTSVATLFVGVTVLRILRRKRIAPQRMKKKRGSHA